MKRITTSLALAVSISLASAPAMAQTAEPPTARELNFTALDSDGNGFVSTSELAASGEADIDLFGDIDANMDGAISVVEMSAWNGAAGPGAGSGIDTTGSPGMTPGSSGIPDTTDSPMLDDPSTNGLGGDPLNSGPSGSGGFER